MRPEGWDEIKKDAIGHAPPGSMLAFEAGADAYEEGLKRQSENGNYSYFNGEFLLPSNYLENDGYLVFIKEDKSG